MPRLRSTLTIVGVLATVVTLSACSVTATMSGMDHGGSSTDSYSGENTDSFNHSDVMFAMGMIPHHQQAIEMADMILAQDGIDQKVIGLATRIKAAQGPEIVEMTAWLEVWDSPMDSMAGMDGMHSGMMSDDDMAALAASTGVEASKLFLEQMTVHHEGAITMARTEISGGKNPAAVELANAIITSQSAEISEMSDILGTLR